MTREEAIDILKLSNPNNIMSIENEEHQRLYNAREEAYKMAISELEKEPCEDAISREKALNITCQCGKWAYDRINELPSVTQKPKYWIDKDNKIYKIPDDIPTMTIQYPTITHGDTISRTEVMKVISDFVTFEKYIDKHNHITFEPLERMINALPSVTQKTKTGHWIKREDDTCWWYVCSECEQEPLKNRWNDDDVLSAFCPNCGANMERDE